MLFVIAIVVTHSLFVLFFVEVNCSWLLFFLYLSQYNYHSSNYAFLIHKPDSKALRESYHYRFEQQLSLSQYLEEQYIE